MSEKSASTRRQLLTGGLVLGLSAAAATSLPAVPVAAAAGRRRGLPDLAAPQVNLRQIVRMQGSLREEDVPWWFTGMIFGVVGEQQPRPLVRFEGLEIYWFRHVPEGFHLGGHTVTFFRDVETSEFLHEFRNPWTDRTDTVRPAVQGGNLEFRYTERGIAPVRLTGEPLGPEPAGPLQLQWHAMRDHVWLQHQTVYPPGMPPMHGQRQTMFARREDLLNERIAALPSVFSSTVFMGWLGWMRMGERPGHVIWHASGAKLRSIDELPREYRERAEREFPERLSARPRSAAGGKR